MSKDKNNSNISLDGLMSKNDVTKEYLAKKHRAPALAFFALIAVIAVAVSSLTIPAAFASSAAFNSAYTYWDGLPTKLAEGDIPLPQRTILLDRNGKEFAQFYSENRVNVTVDKVAPIFIKALVATEDSRFYENNGFDTIGLVRSFVSTAGGGEKQGASGITQQLVKNLLILNAQSEEDLAAAKSRVAKTKIQELKYAIALEKEYSKEKILEMYMNTVYFGNNAYGIGAAAQTYFSTTPDKLTLGQSATLVGVINNPTMYDPVTAPEGSESRKNMVLGRLFSTAKITKAEYDKTVATKTALKKGSTENGCGQSAYPYYCELVRQEILSNVAYGKTPEDRQTFLRRGGMTITTAMDPKAMDNARYEATQAYDDTNRVATSIASVKPGTGHILAIGQNRTWGNGEGKTEVIYAKAKRQPGSSFKAFTLATAFEQGIPASTRMLSNSGYVPPAGFAAPSGGFSNYGFYNYGVVDGYTATKLSLNVWFVRLMERTGVVPVAELANRLGLSIPTSGDGAVGPSTLSLTLGAWEASPLEMSNAYATFASGGIYCNPVSVLSAVRNDTGEKLKVSDPDCHQALMPNVANTMNAVLKEPLKEGGSAGKLPIPGGFDQAGKTGTSNDWADAWMLGYTPALSTAVWTGDPRGGSSYPLDGFVQYGQWREGGVVGDGSEASGPIWRSYMADMLTGTENIRFANPSTSVGAAVTARSIPNVVGLDVNAAITTLQSYGFTPVLEEKTTGDDKIVGKDIVMAQSPAGGNSGSHKQKIVLTLSPNSDTKITIVEKKE